LAQDEFASRATVQKAREVQGTIELMQAREAKQRAIARKQELEKWSRSGLTPQKKLRTLVDDV
jgi:hypothetical protein